MARNDQRNQGSDERSDGLREKMISEPRHQGGDAGPHPRLRGVDVVGDGGGGYMGQARRARSGRRQKAMEQGARKIVKRAIRGTILTTCSAGTATARMMKPRKRHGIKAGAMRRFSCDWEDQHSAKCMAPPIPTTSARTLDGLFSSALPSEIASSAADVRRYRRLRVQT